MDSGRSKGNAGHHPDVPNGTSVVFRGQVTTMTTAYQQLFVGLALAIVLIYLLIVVGMCRWSSNPGRTNRSAVR